MLSEKQNIDFNMEEEDVVSWSQLSYTCNLPFQGGKTYR